MLFHYYFVVVELITKVREIKINFYSYSWLLGFNRKSYIKQCISHVAQWDLFECYEILK